VVLTPYQAPIASSFPESWIANLKRKCLNLFFCFSLGQLDFIVQTHALYHNGFRPYQALGNRSLDAQEAPPLQAAETEVGPIGRQRWLGGLLNHYCRQTA
jgi:hypothetical protein